MKKILIVMLSVSLILCTFTFNISASAAVIGGKPAAKLLFTFDDGWKDQLTVAAPILSAAGFKATAYVCKEASTQSWGAIDYMNVTQLNTIYNQYGWDIGNHTVTHPNDGNLTDQTTLQKLTTEYKDCQDWIISNKWDRGAYHVCYPSGMFSDPLISILKGMGVKTGRATIDGLQTIPVANYYKLPVQYVEGGNVADVESFISSAVTSGSTAILMIHKVEVNSGNLVIKKSDFQTIVNYAKLFVDKSQLEVMTISDWYNALANAETPKITTQPADVTVNVLGTANLQVAASVGKGSLSYQWYRNTTNSSIGGTSITGASGSSYSAPTTTAGTTYYYCVVTNTDTSVSGTQTATATSSAAKVVVNAAAPSIIIDGNASDWASIPALVTASGQNITSVKMTNDNNYYYICIQGSNLSTKYGIFLDTDNNSNTGYKSSLWTNGADYYIESGILYKSNGSSWSWTSLGTSSLTRASNTTVIEIRLARSAINVIGGTIQIGVVNYNNTWGILSYLPLSKLMAAYKVK